jgi:hypothetical protein
MARWRFCFREHEWLAWTECLVGGPEAGSSTFFGRTTLSRIPSGD